MGRRRQPRELLGLTAQPPDADALEGSIESLVELGGLTSVREDADITVPGAFNTSVISDSCDSPEGSHCKLRRHWQVFCCVESIDVEQQKDTWIAQLVASSLRAVRSSGTS